MFDLIQIHDQLEEYIVNKNISDIVIIPFGENGVLTKSIMKNAFGITPVAIADTFLSKSLDDVMDLERLRKEFHSEWNVVLTIESKVAHEELLNYLREPLITT